MNYTFSVAEEEGEERSGGERDARDWMVEGRQRKRREKKKVKDTGKGTMTRRRGKEEEVWNCVRQRLFV